MHTRQRTTVTLLLITALLTLPALWHPTRARASTMIFSRTGHTATRLLDGRVLVVGGNTATAAELYAPTTDTWSLTGAMAFSRFNHAAVRLADGCVLIVGGTDSKQAEIYDPTTERWSLTAAMSVMHASPSAALLPDGRVLVIGGTSPQVINEIYDPALDRWSLAAPNPGGLHGVARIMPLTDGRVFVIGGGNARLSVAEIYTPLTDSWTVLSLGEEILCQGASPLPGDRFLILGSDFSTGVSGYLVAKIADPAYGSITHIQPPLVYPMDMTPLPDGNVLVTYGSQASIYESAANRWSHARPLATERIGYTTTPLDNGLILLAGSTPSYSSGPAMTTAELYDPMGAILNKHIYLPSLSNSVAGG